MKNNDLEKNGIYDKEILEMLEKSNKASTTSKKEVEKLLNKALESTNYQAELDKISVSCNNKVIYTDGNIQLMFENGEFFEVSSTDATKEKKKKTRKEATDMYVEYFINHVLNPLIERKKEMGIPQRITNLKEKEKVSQEKTKDIISPKTKAYDKKQSVEYER